MLAREGFGVNHKKANGAASLSCIFNALPGNGWPEPTLELGLRVRRAQVSHLGSRR